MPDTASTGQLLDKYGFQVLSEGYLRKMDTTLPWNLTVVSEKKVIRRTGGYGIDVSTKRYSLYPGARVTLLDGSDLEYWGVLDNHFLFRVYSHDINGVRSIDDIGLTTLVRDIGVKEIINKDEIVLYTAESETEP